MEAFALTFRGHDAGRMIALRGKLPMLADGAATTWIQVAVQGTWEGHPAGAFTFDRQAMDSIVYNFKAQVNPVPLTYEHPDHDGSGQPIPAAGWIRDMSIHSDGSLWADVEFTDRAAAMVRAGEYRFCSVVVDFASTSRTTGDDVGPELYEVGLVNSPFLDGMKPITLSRRRRLAAGDKSAMNDADLIKEALNALGPEVTVEKLSTWVEARKAILAIESGEEPGAEGAAEEAGAEMAAVEASEEPPEIKASHDLEDPAPVVELAEGVDSEAGTAPDAAVDDGDPAVQAAAAGALAKLGEAAGMGLPDVIAAIEGDLEGFAALLTGAPVDGTEAVPGDEAAGAMLSRAQSKDLRVALTAAKAATAEAEAEVVNLRAEGLARDITALVAASKLGDAEADLLRKLTVESPAIVAERLAEADKGAPILATTPEVKPSGKGNKKLSDSIDRTSDEYLTYDGSLKGRIPDSDARHAKVVELMDSREERAQTRRLKRRRAN